MTIVGGEAQIAVELETGVRHIDQQFAKGAVFYFPSIMMPFERFIGEVFEQRGEFDWIVSFPRQSFARATPCP